MRKPISLIVIAWLWIVGGVFDVLSGIPTIPGVLSMRQQFDAEGVPADAQAPMKLMMYGFLAWVVITMLFSAGGAVCGVGLFRLREWGRRGLEIATSGVIVLQAFVVTLLAILWFPQASLHESPGLVTGVTFVASALWIGAGIVMMPELRSSTIRGAIAVALTGLLVGMGLLIVSVLSRSDSIVLAIAGAGAAMVFLSFFVGQLVMLRALRGPTIRSAVVSAMAMSSPGPAAVA